MKKILFVTLALTAFAALLGSCNDAPKSQTVPIVLFDTDVGNDIDDVLALQMLFNYDCAGKIDLRAVTISKCNPHSIEFVDGYCRFNGYGAMPLGFAYNGPNPEDNSYLLPTLAAEYNGEKLLKPQRTFESNLPEGYKVLRSELAAAPDSSVELIATGPLTNIARLLDSPSDEYSDLTGVELVEAKVRKLSIMSANFSTENPFAEWNVLQDLKAAQKVYAKCPVPLVASGFEVGGCILYPHQSILNDFGTPEAHPLCVAYQSYMTMPYDRQTWDLTSVFDAVDSDKTIFKHSPKGTITIDNAGVSTFEENPEGLHCYLIVEPIDVPRAVEALVARVTSK